MRPASLAIDAGQHLHQRGLAGAIFADQGVHFAGAQLKLALAERMNAGKDLLDPFHQNQDIVHVQSLKLHMQQSSGLV